MFLNLNLIKIKTMTNLTESRYFYDTIFGEFRDIEKDPPDSRFAGHVYHQPPIKFFDPRFESTSKQEFTDPRFSKNHQL
ncbi:MAG: hypothetical protein ACI88L_000171 [Candidatus Paceibacteria bacterium]